MSATDTTFPTAFDILRLCEPAGCNQMIERDAPIRRYTGYLSPHVDRILALHQDGAETRTIAEMLYQSGVRADTTNPYVLQMKRKHHINNLRLMVLHVLQRHGLRLRRARLPRWPKPL